MAAPPEPLALAAEFPAVSRDRWRALVSDLLARSGRPEVVDPELELATTTYDGITINPLYTAADAPGLATDGRPGQPPFVRAATARGAAGTGWDVRQRHSDADPVRTNRAVLADLTTGATSLWLVLGRGGLAVADLAAALEGVHLDRAPIALDAGAETAAAAATLLELARRLGVDPAALSGTLGADPVGAQARTGVAADPALLGELAGRVGAHPELRLATVDATIYHEAGASDADEIGIATAVGVSYLRALTGALGVDDALAALDFRFAVTADQFLSIAKLRAARRVWDRVAELSGAATSRRGQRQHAVTSAAMLTQRDPWVNLLRTTIGCFAASVGGAEAITVLPFDSAIGVPDEFARRIARNTHAVLHDESSLARVIDAGGGSWYVESLTDQLAEKAWATFTAVERAGGALAAVSDGTVADLIAATRHARADDIAHRRAPITGVSEFAFVDEQPVVRPPAPAAPSGGPLPRVRYAQDFEALRDRADAAPEPPTVFLAALGPLASATPRLAFANNLLQAGGIASVVGSGPLDDLVAAFRASRMTVACLCASDRRYAESAAPAAAALRAAGATHVWLAGRADVDGVDGNLFTGCDALAVLRTILDQLGVA